MTCKTLLIAAALCLTAGAATAGDRPSMTVKAGDLDLASPRDAQRLYDRLYDAASAVCGGGRLVTYYPLPDPKFLACRDGALDAAVDQSHAPLLIALRQAAKARAQVAAR